MNNRWMRTLKIFSLAIRVTLDFRKISRVSRKLDGDKRDQVLETLYARSGTRVRMAALELHGLIIKVGQFLSTRTDVLPQAFTRELAQLQDAVPPAPFHLTKPLIENELGAPISAIFAEFNDKAIAAASLGQVYKAQLIDGQTVAVKVLRPDIERLAAIDLSALERVINYAYKYTKTAKRLNLIALYREFREMVRQELDYRLEAENLKKFRKNFADEKQIVIPRLYDTYTARRVLIMEFIEGAKITDVATYQSWGISTQAIVDLLVGAYLKQLLTDGFIHVDPHPGNLFVLQDGSLCFVDFGMMSELPKEHRRIFTRLIKAAVARNMDTMVDAIDELGFLQPYANKQVLKRALGYIWDRLSGIELTRGPELSQFTDDFQQFLYDEPIIIQAKYMFLGRAVGLVSGLSSTLNPDIKWLPLLKDRALPMLNQPLDFEMDGTTGIRRVIRDVVSSLFGETGATASDIVFDQTKETALALIRVPGQLERLLRKTEQGDLYIRTDFSDLTRRMERQERVTNRLTWTLLFAFSGGIGAYLHGRGDYFTSDISWIGTVFFGLGLLINSLTTRRIGKNTLRSPHRPLR